MAVKKFGEEVEKSFKNVEVLLSQMLLDRSVPRNVKRVAQQGIKLINDRADTQGVIASNVLYMVEDLSQDPNIPFSSRTTIYRIISILESIKD